MPGTSLVVPVVLWGKHAPTHCISCIYLSSDQKTLATGCYDGQICLWQVDPNTLQMTPRCLLVGHTAPILCLSKASIVQDNNYIVSSSESGEMCTWDLVDGKCRECVKLPQVHTNIQAYQMSNCEDLRLFCNGYYPEIMVMDPFSLEVLFVLSSKVNPDWISALHVLKPVKCKNDVLLALTTTGMFKVWTLLGHESKHSEPFYENESKQTRCLNAICLQCCAYNQRTVLIVCSKYWQIYDASDFSVLCSNDAPRGERWMSGDFLAVDRILVWSDAGKGYLYKLPTKKLRGKNVNSCIPDNKDFHKMESDSPFLYCILSQPDLKPLSCPPAMRCVITQRDEIQNRYLIRGDSEGIVLLWRIPDVPADKIFDVQQQKIPHPLQMAPSLNTSLTKAWASMVPGPVGVLDQLEQHEDPMIKLTASIYLPAQCKLVLGREDGTIILVPATQTIMLQLLHGNHQNYENWPPHQVLSGHGGRVNCLLYPYREHSRYDKNHLVSGGVDFAVCLWDLISGSLLHRFCVHAGEITQLLVPPNNCSTRVQKCICSVASDHSVTLVSLAEKKCVCLASRHLFPVTSIKWRPLDDFMIIGCSDGTVYVWQMETGHLDRVLQGIAAEEVLYACEEHESLSSVSSEVGMGLANPAVHFFRGLRHRNLSAIRHATQRGLHQLQQLGAHANNDDPHMQRSHTSPLVIQGVRTNPKDPESHILFFDIESLIVDLLSDEYSAMSPQSLEAAGLISQSEYLKVAALTQSASPDAHKKIVDFFGKVKDKAENVERIIKEKDKHGVLAKLKEGAENVHTKIQAKAESVLKGESAKSGGETGKSKPILGVLETNHGMEIAQLLLSLLHAWGLDSDLDHVCQIKLGLLRPMVPLSFGVLSKGNYMSLFLPTWHNAIPVDERVLAEVPHNNKIPAELIKREQLTRVFTSRTHWELSTTLTSNHLLAIIALSHTLMSMSNATFVPEQERNRKLHRQSSRVNWSKTDEEHEEIFTQQQAQIKQGWSLLATLHCVLLPDKVVQNGAKHFKRPQVEMMAKRWQHHCVEVREAAQALLLAELGRMGPKGRKALVDSWAQFLPLYTQTETINQQGVNNSTNNVATTGGHQPGTPEALEEEYEEEEEEQVRKPSSIAELKRKQSTAVILLGVMGAEFGQDITADPTKRRQSGGDRRGSFVDGFGIGNNNLARLTSMALAHLLLAPPSAKLPAHTPLRRAAIDLVGRGFTVWEPYLDISKVLLGLLELCSEADRLVPSMTYGLPLTPQADSCRTARHALTLIATARPAAFITTMAKEVARYNALQQNAQAINVTMNNTVLHKAKPEILRSVELLIEKMQNEMADLLVELMDIILHCLDPGHLKTKGLQDVFPAVCRFNQVSHCPATRRIAVGASNGHLTLYELRQGKNTAIHAHSSAITACAFSPDGKFLVSYCSGDNKLSFWQTSTGMFGLGQSQTRCVKSYSTAPIADVSRLNPMRLARLIWINNRTVTLMLADGSETRFNV